MQSCPTLTFVVDRIRLVTNIAINQQKFFQAVSCALCALASGQAYNPTILQDSRDLPKTDGRFGFLYRTEDGIAHAAKSEGDGIVHGRYTYTDPTGFKLNFNYNAGTKVTPGYNYDQAAPAQQSGAYDGYQNQQQASGGAPGRTRPQYNTRNDLYNGYDYPA